MHAGSPTRRAAGVHIGAFRYLNTGIWKGNHQEPISIDESMLMSGPLPWLPFPKALNPESLCSKIEGKMGKAYSLILQGHSKGLFAKDKYGVGCDPTSEKAVSWCAMGALMATYGHKDNLHIVSLRLQQAIGGRAILHWSDASSQEEVAKAMLELDI